MYRTTMKHDRFIKTASLALHVDMYLQQRHEPQRKKHRMCSDALFEVANLQAPLKPGRYVAVCCLSMGE